MSLKNWIMGIATVATMTGTVKAEQKPEPAVITQSAYDYNTELKSLDEALKNSTDLQNKDLIEIGDWSNRIINNPQDPLSREAFKKIKAEALRVTNIFVMVNQYYNSEYLEGLHHDKLLKSQKELRVIMDRMLSQDNVRKEIKEACVQIHEGFEAKDLATMRYYEQELYYQNLQEHPEKLAPYHNALRGNAKLQKVAKNMERTTYEKYGVNIAPEFTYWEHDGSNTRYMEHLYLKNRHLKEQIYMLCLHASLDDAFNYQPSIYSSVTFQGKDYSIPNVVGIAFKNYAIAYAAREQGKKLTKEQVLLLDNAPVEIGSYRDAYLKSNFDRFCEQMDKPEGEKISFLGALGYENEAFTKYIRIAKKPEHSSNEIQTMELLKKDYPLIVKAEEYYKIHKLLSENDKNKHKQASLNAFIANNMTSSIR